MRALLYDKQVVAWIPVHPDFDEVGHESNREFFEGRDRSWQEPIEPCEGRAFKSDGKGSASHGVLVSMELHLVLVGVEVVDGVLHSIESFDLRHFELCWEREV